jgi:hypothetical protein
MSKVMFVVENGVTGEWKDWFNTEELADAFINKIEARNETLRGHHIIRESIQNN